MNDRRRRSPSTRRARLRAASRWRATLAAGPVCTAATAAWRRCAGRRAAAADAAPADAVVRAADRRHSSRCSRRPTRRTRRTTGTGRSARRRRRVSRERERTRQRRGDRWHHRHVWSRRASCRGHRRGALQGRGDQGSGAPDHAGRADASRFRAQRFEDFYLGWSAAAGDFNHDGVLDVTIGNRYYLGRVHRIARGTRAAV